MSNYCNWCGHIVPEYKYIIIYLRDKYNRKNGIEWQGCTACYIKKLEKNGGTQ